MQKTMKYVIFQTKWGYFGLAGTDSGLYRTYLPMQERGKTESRILENLPDAKFDKSYFKNLQEQIIAYFDGDSVNFGTDIHVLLNGFRGFSCRVLTACRTIKFGQTTTYAGLAEKAGRHDAGRAVGNALAKNPLPLIIPCHRVIRSDGKLGGFSAPGGISLKSRLISHEKHLL
jgi:methylated-DNA-[protein]-cysteine S-methyltransferase